MKHKGLYALATVAMLALFTGCGSNPRGENGEKKVTEAVSPTGLPEGTVTPETTATLEPTATPVPANYMEAKGIEVLGAGWHTCKGYIAERWDENKEPVVALADCEYRFQVEEEDVGGGSKIIRATLSVVPYMSPAGWSSYVMGGFVDLQTGKTFFPMMPDQPHTTLLTREEEEIELQLFLEFERPSVINPYYTERYTLVCPSEYEDAGFYFAGWNEDNEAYQERAGVWKLLHYVRHGKSDMMVFGVNEGLETMQEK